MTARELAKLVLRWAEADDVVASKGWGAELDGTPVDELWDSCKAAMVDAAYDIMNTTKGE